MAHPLSLTHFSLTNLQTQPRETNCAKPGLQLWSRTVPLPLKTTVWNQAALLWHRKNMINIQCKVLGGCIFSPVCNLRVKQRASFSLVGVLLLARDKVTCPFGSLQCVQQWSQRFVDMPVGTSDSGWGASGSALSFPTSPRGQWCFYA